MSIKNNFREYLQIKGLSDRSIETYLDYYDKFGDPLEFTQEKVNSFVLRYNNQPPARAFVNNLKIFLLVNQIGMDIKDVDLVKRTGSKKRKLPDFITEQQVKHIENGFSSERNKLMLYFNFYLGVRVDELVNIGIFDFRLDWNMVEEAINNNQDIGIASVLIRGKGSKERIVYLPSEILKRAYSWLKEVGLKGEPGENTSIFNIGVRRWEQLLAKASVNTIGKKIYPHMLRHSCATWLHYDHGWDLKEIAEYLGHESVSTTEIYTHVRHKEIHDKYSKIFQDNLNQDSSQYS